MLVNIIAIFVLFFSFIGGMKEGGVKNFFSLISLFIAIPLTGISYYFLASLLSFLPGENWENFMGFYITFSLIIAISYLLFILPRKLIQLLWKRGIIFRLVGGIINLLNASIGIVLLVLVFGAYPIIGWLQNAITGSGVVNWLISNLSFIGDMLPFA
ncbi:CvpA family protein [Chloroflexota bacterium]